MPEIWGTDVQPMGQVSAPLFGCHRAGLLDIRLNSKAQGEFLDGHSVEDLLAWYDVL